MLIRVFLHAEFISAMKTVENPMIFMKNAKKIKRRIVLVICVNFLEIFTETLEQNIRKVRKYFHWMEKKTSKAKLEIFKFLRKSVLPQGYSL